MRLRKTITEVQDDLNRRLTAMETRAHPFYDDPKGGRNSGWINVATGVRYRWAADRVYVDVNNIPMTGGELVHPLPADTAPSAQAGRFFTIVDPGGARYQSHIYIGTDAVLHITSGAPDGTFFSSGLDWPGGEFH